MGLTSRSGARLRRLVAFAVEPRFEALNARFDRIEAAVSVADSSYPSTLVENDLFALRQQMDEALDLLRAQHARIRALEEALEHQRSGHS